VAGSAWAQTSNTKYTPYIGSKHTYTVAGTFSGDNINFYVTLESVDNPTANTQAVGVANAEITGGHATYAYRSFTSTGDDINIEIEWKIKLAAAAPYRLWVQATDGTCSNYRHMVILPVDYVVDFVVYAFGYNDDFTDTPAAGATKNECWPLLANTEVTEATPSLTETATTTIYYRVSRVAYDISSGSAVLDNAITNDWTFVPSFTGETYANMTINYGFTTAPATLWSDGDGAIEPLVANGNNVYFAVTIPLDQTANRPIALAIASAADVNGKADDNATTASTLDAANSATNNVNRLPSIGAFN
jgi:hypothetical protein